jgi:hypothetical protein
LLGYLPLIFARLFRNSAFSAGCGQLFLVRRRAYEAIGGHAAIKASQHDGLTLPRAFRRSRLRTELCDPTNLTVCRMYRSGRELWNGLAKNAGEGLGSPLGIVPWTILLLGGQVAPFVLVAWRPLAGITAIAATYAMRFHAAWRFHQSFLSALLHPIGILLLVAIQWHALLRRLAGRPVGWKGRHPAISRA